MAMMLAFFSHLQLEASAPRGSQDGSLQAPELECGPRDGDGGPLLMEDVPSDAYDLEYGLGTVLASFPHLQVL